MKIHPNKQAALAALKEYRDTVNALSERLGVYEECNEQTGAVDMKVEFHDEEKSLRALRLCRSI